MAIPTYKTAVYDRSSKKWRILNMNTGRLYEETYDNRQQAYEGITKDYKTVDGYKEVTVTTEALREALATWHGH
jgi:hypothetical protein